MNDLLEKEVTSTTPFDRAYFMDGVRTGVSNYENYTWKPHLTVPACRKIKEYFGARSGESIVDWGCSRGYYVKGFRAVGLKANGYDISEWAIANCDPEVREMVSNVIPNKAFDWALVKDCGEHMTEAQFESTMTLLHGKISKGMLIIVPLADRTHGPYVREDDEKDKTHILRWTLDDWMSVLETHCPDFNVNASYHIHGIKPASAQVKHSCGFFTLVRP